MSTWVLIDFETASGCDLKKAGEYVYAEDPTTEILCLGFTFAPGSFVECLTPRSLYPSHEDARELRAACDDPECLFIAHKAPFERAIWREIMHKRLGWPDLPISRWHDTMAVALQKGLPGALEKLLSAIHATVEKDMVGNKFTLGLSKPNKKTGELDRTDVAIQRAADYCMTDVVSEVHVLKFTRKFQGGERAVWELDQKINDRGIKIDSDYVNAGLRIVNRTLPEIEKKFRAMTDGILFPGGLKPTQGEKFKEWLRWNGLDLPDLTKERVDHLLGMQEEEDDDESADNDTVGVQEDSPAYRALKLRALGASASIKKLPAMLHCRGSDGRARGLLQYHGAGPGRWAGRILQPHNFPRAGLDIGEDAQGLMQTAKMDQLVTAILTEDLDYIRMVYGEPIEAIAAGLRHAIIAEKGKDLLIADFAQIEARIVLALAGQQDALKLFVEGDPYCAMAEQIFGHKVTKKENPEERQTGKNTILGCGFGMGPPKFKARYAKDKPIEFAEECVAGYRKKMAPLVPKLWYGIEDAAVDAVWEGHATEFNGIRYEVEGPWLTARLPSGRKLYYFEPHKTRRPAPWDKHELKAGISAMTYKAGRWIRRDLYGGLLVENVVQAMARDLLVSNMFLCEENNLPIVLTVHDEGIVEDSTTRFKEFEQIMGSRPQWAADYQIPVAVEGMVSARYRK
jgi:DNA polymerase